MKRRNASAPAMIAGAKPKTISAAEPLDISQAQLRKIIDHLAKGAVLGDKISREIEAGGSENIEPLFDHLRRGGLLGALKHPTQ